MENLQKARPWDEPSSINRGEFEALTHTGMFPNLPRVQETLEKYRDIINQQAISRVQEWRLERLEAQAKIQTVLSPDGVRPAWADSEQLLYVGILTNLLKYVHNARSHHTLTSEQADAILKVGSHILGKTVVSPTWVSKTAEQPPGQEPTAHSALLATLDMLDWLHGAKPEAAIRFWQRESMVRRAQPQRSKADSHSSSEAVLRKSKNLR